MAKVNFRQQKRQKEMARKQRQAERLLRRGERLPSETPAATGVNPPKPTDGST